MKELFNKYKVLIIIMVVVICLIAYLIITNNKTQEEVLTNKECVDILGGGFIINFITNGGNELESVNRCIGCGPNAYDELPVPVKDGYTFGGWYYDKDLINKVEGTSTLNVNPNPKYENGCIVSYNDVILYALWK